jgi:Pyruvate/2-oxoglutarate dehydrogenase complex, dehydrogenase (E1) component, eukaryotic type, alpha subunit
VSFTATDNAAGSGISSTHYTTDGTDPTLASPAYSASITVSSTATVKFRSWDIAGNVEATKSQAIQVTPDAAPVAALTVTPTSGVAPFAVTADASGSTDTDATPIASYAFSFGDGTANRGDFHENVNLAASWKLPIVYVCQNNGWSISQRASAYLPGRIVDRAIGYGIPGVLADGQDVEEVRSSVREAIAWARAGNGPTLIEARTSRVRGHWAGDAGAYRTPEERQAPWRDPLVILGERLIASGDADADDLSRIDAQVHADAEDAVSKARLSPDITADDIGYEDVYA